MKKRYTLLLISICWMLHSQRDFDNWQFVGPKQNHYQYKGLFMSVWANDANVNEVMAGSSNGGLFYTNTALDSLPEWVNITDNLPYMNFGVTGIVVKNHTNSKEIYIATCSGGGLLTKYFGNGILHTVNGGKSWERVGPAGKTNYDFPINGLTANPQNQEEMVAFYKEDLYFTKNAWRSFIRVRLPFHKNISGTEITQVAFAPYEKNKVYITTKTYLSNKAQLFVSKDFGYSWEDITPKDVACERIAIGVINNEKYKGKFYITNGNTAIYLKYFDGNVFSKNLNSIPVKHFAATSFWCLSLNVNSIDTSVVYLSLTETSKSNDGGKTFTKIGTYNGVNTHADVRGSYLPVSNIGGENDVLLLANDGGISMSNMNKKKGDPFFRNINGNGLNANQFWGINVLQSDTFFIAGGAQDNGGFFIKKNKEANNLKYCGDGYYALVINDSIALVLGNPPNFLRYNINTNESRFISIPDPNCEARRPLILKDSFVYVAYHDVWRANVKEIVDGNIKFTNVSFIPKKSDPVKGPQNREIKALCITNNNSALLGYASPNWDATINEGKLYFCENILAKKPTYIDITSVTANKYVELCRWSQVESIVADKKVNNVFYVIYKDVFDQKNSEVYKLIYYPDSHKVDLTNISYNLKKVGFNKLAVDNQTNQLFVASNDGVYTKSLNNEDTVYKSLNFKPNVLVSDLDINYYTNTLYVATFGRGLWKQQVPSLHNQTQKINKNKSEVNPVKVDGKLIIRNRKKYTVLSKLIITQGSVIELGKKSTLILKSKNAVVNENNEIINIKNYLKQHKTAILNFIEN